jgi:hypothetical protein
LNVRVDVKSFESITEENNKHNFQECIKKVSLQAIQSVLIKIKEFTIFSILLDWEISTLTLFYLGLLFPLSTKLFACSLCLFGCICWLLVYSVCFFQIQCKFKFKIEKIYKIFLFVFLLHIIIFHFFIILIIFIN